MLSAGGAGSGAGSIPVPSSPQTQMRTVAMLRAHRRRSYLAKSRVARSWSSRSLSRRSPRFPGIFSVPCAWALPSVNSNARAATRAKQAAVASAPSPELRRNCARLELPPARCCHRRSLRALSLAAPRHVCAARSPHLAAPPADGPDIAARAQASPHSHTPRACSYIIAARPS